ncbi:hypothetical protein [Pseudomonas sp.]
MNTQNCFSLAFAAIATACLLSAVAADSPGGHDAARQYQGA